MATHKYRKLHGWNAFAVCVIILAPVLLFFAEFWIRDAWCDSARKFYEASQTSPVKDYLEALRIPAMPSPECHPHEFFAPTCLAAAFALLLACLIWPEEEPKMTPFKPAPQFSLNREDQWAHRYAVWFADTYPERAANWEKMVCYNVDRWLVFIGGALAVVVAGLWLLAVLEGVSAYHAIEKYTTMSGETVASLAYVLSSVLTVLKFRVME